MTILHLCTISFVYIELTPLSLFYFIPDFPIVPKPGYSIIYPVFVVVVADVVVDVVVAVVVVAAVVAVVSFYHKFHCYCNRYTIEY